MAPAHMAAPPQALMPGSPGTPAATDKTTETTEASGPIRVGHATPANQAPFATLRLEPIKGVQDDLYFSIDVECVATGPTHNDRCVAQIAVVDQWENVILNVYVKPDKPVQSYLYDLTGLTKELLEDGQTFDEARTMLLAALPKHAILVGQGILSDVQWTQLTEGEDFGGMQDLAGLYRFYNKKYNKFSYHSLHHKAKCLLGLDEEVLGTGQHNAATDAIMSMRLYWLFRRIEKNDEELALAHNILMEAAPTPSFAVRNAQYEGVCMGNRKQCTCGAPFFF
jgi:DNA polymerase III epsilon subunit-like protein